MKRIAEQIVNDVMALVKKIDNLCRFDRVDVEVEEEDKEEVARILESMYCMYKRHNNELGMVQTEIAMASVRG